VKWLGLSGPVADSQLTIWSFGRARSHIPFLGRRDASTSFLLSERDTRIALEATGFIPILWRDDIELALDWFKTMTPGSPPNGLNLGVVMGRDMREMANNLASNLREDRLGVLSAILMRD
jgi:hypothetical protein